MKSLILEAREITLTYAIESLINFSCRHELFHPIFEVNKINGIRLSYIRSFKEYCIETNNYYGKWEYAFTKFIINSMIKCEGKNRRNYNFIFDLYTIIPTLKSIYFAIRGYGNIEIPLNFLENYIKTKSKNIDLLNNYIKNNYNDFIKKCLNEIYNYIVNNIIGSEQYKAEVADIYLKNKFLNNLVEKYEKSWHKTFEENFLEKYRKKGILALSL